MKCWICGANADSGEHMIKASDIRCMFGHISQEHPLFRRVDDARREMVQGIRSKKLKFSAPLCSFCNNTRTQQHDQSWTLLCAFLKNRRPAIRPNTVVRLNGAFTGGLRKSMLGVHLYFLKLFGCLIVGNSIPINIQPFAQSILTGSPHLNVYLSFLAVSKSRLREHAAITPVYTVKLGGRIIAANWFYCVGRIAVNVTYAEAIQKQSSRVHLWHPSTHAKSIIIDDI